MRYLLVTCVLSDFARGEPRTLARVKATPPDRAVVSSTTAMELEFGLALEAQHAPRVSPRSVGCSWRSGVEKHLAAPAVRVIP